MQIKKIGNRVNQDLWALYECEYCGHVMKGDAVDDVFFYKTVVPKKLCPKCKRSSNMLKTGEYSGDAKIVEAENS